jgi:hypothetical protein
VKPSWRQSLSAAFILAGAAAVAISGLPVRGDENPKVGTIRGKVVGPDGKPLFRAAVNIGDQRWKPPPGKPNATAEFVATTKSDAEGQFQVQGLKPGLYWVGVSKKTKVKGFFMLGLTAPFELAAGKVVDLGTIRTQKKDVMPSFLRDIEEGRSNR